MSMNSTAGSSRPRISPKVKSTTSLYPSSTIAISTAKGRAALSASSSLNRGVAASKTQSSISAKTSTSREKENSRPQPDTLKKQSNIPIVRGNANPIRKSERATSANPSWRDPKATTASLSKDIRGPTFGKPKQTLATSITRVSGNTTSSSDSLRHKPQDSMSTHSSSGAAAAPTKAKSMRATIKSQPLRKRADGGVIVSVRSVMESASTIDDEVLDNRNLDEILEATTAEELDARIAPRPAFRPAGRISMGPVRRATTFGVVVPAGGRGGVIDHSQKRASIYAGPVRVAKKYPMSANLQQSATEDLIAPKPNIFSLLPEKPISTAPTVPDIPAEVSHNARLQKGMDDYFNRNNKANPIITNTVTTSTITQHVPTSFPPTAINNNAHEDLNAKLENDPFANHRVPPAIALSLQTKPALLGGLLGTPGRPNLSNSHLAQGSPSIIATPKRIIEQNTAREIGLAFLEMSSKKKKPSALRFGIGNGAGETEGLRDNRFGIGNGAGDTEELRDNLLFHPFGLAGSSEERPNYSQHDARMRSMSGSSEGRRFGDEGNDGSVRALPGLTIMRSDALRESNSTRDYMNRGKEAEDLAGASARAREIDEEKSLDDELKRVYEKLKIGQMFSELGPGRATRDESANVETASSAPKFAPTFGRSQSYQDESLNDLSIRDLLEDPVSLRKPVREMPMPPSSFASDPPPPAVWPAKAARKAPAPLLPNPLEVLGMMAPSNSGSATKVNSSLSLDAFKSENKFAEKNDTSHTTEEVQNGHGRNEEMYTSHVSLEELKNSRKVLECDDAPGIEKVGQAYRERTSPTWREVTPRKARSNEYRMTGSRSPIIPDLEVNSRIVGDGHSVTSASTYMPCVDGHGGSVSDGPSKALEQVLSGIESERVVASDAFRELDRQLQLVRDAVDSDASLPLRRGGSGDTVQPQTQMTLSDMDEHPDENLGSLTNAGQLLPSVSDVNQHDEAVNGRGLLELDVGSDDLITRFSQLQTQQIDFSKIKCDLDELDDLERMLEMEIEQMEASSMMDA
ncbi:hypothetical protein HDU76_013077 [Blyttiomyces sp. JEL0837]|nr:hypothetical protein HDU76_013077 [Blyttiomyces sp. JEL0837]